MTAGAGAQAIDRLRAAIVEWRNTPYAAGQQRAGSGGGADCVRFVDAVLRTYTQRNPPALPREAQDASLHDPEVVRCFMRHFLRSYPSTALPNYFLKSSHTRFRPGDVLALSTTTVPMHVGIVGDDPRVFWHASIEGVRSTSVQGAATSGWSLRAAYRPLLNSGDSNAA